eukprot:539809_1
MTLQHILSLLIYCNYTQLQYEFSKTYRMYEGRKHKHYYYLGKYLKMSCNTFGEFAMSAYKGYEHTFYHGVSQKLLFHRYIHTPGINAPLSTSLSFEVAVNFANSNNGLIIHFNAWDRC